jgi:ubiquinol-cytochrome c reductase cytochrome c1 subunit
MKNLLLVCLLSIASFSAYAAGGAAIPLDHVKADIIDQESMQRGLALFTNYCFGCHSMSYARYERNADDLGIPHNVYEENLIFGDAKIGELMHIAMPPDQAKIWFGTLPPDLTLTARLRGPDWVYSYLRGFYADPARPYGVNNVVFKDVGMPHVLAGLQGVCAQPPKLGVTPEVDPLSGNIVKKSGCTEYAAQGSMTPEQYDDSIMDLVNFLAYVAEPSRLQSERLGVTVLIFLAFLFVFVYFLNKEYWRDIH